MRGAVALRPDTYQPPTYGERSEQHTEPPLPHNLTRKVWAKEKGRALVDSALGLAEDCSEPSELTAPLLGAADHVLCAVRTQNVERDDHAAPAGRRLPRQNADALRIGKALDQTRL